jgi:hypothetical protein
MLQESEVDVTASVLVLAQLKFRVQLLQLRFLDIFILSPMLYAYLN